MQKVFLDTNVLLDYLFDREEFAQDAEAILAVGQDGKVSLCVSALTFANIAYIARRKYKGVSLYALLEDIRKMCEVAPVDETVIDSALEIQAHDFEDAIQYCSAQAAACDCIVTRNQRDFGFAKVAVYTPHQFLAQTGGVL